MSELVAEGQEARELVRLCAAEHARMLGAPVSRARLARMVFRTREGLPDGAPGRSLPFYWDMDGPHSPQLSDIVDQLVSEGVLREADGGLEAAAGPLCGHDGGLAGAVRVLADMLSDPASADHIPEAEGLARYRSPRRFYESFGVGFREKLRSFLYDGDSGIGAEDLYRDLWRGYAASPGPREFARFNRIYGDYSRIIVALAGLELTDDARQRMLDSVDTVCEAFASGARIAEHDAHFEPQVPRWEVEFAGAVEAMEGMIDGLHDLASSLGLGDTGRLSFAAFVDRVLEARSRGELRRVRFEPWTYGPGLMDGCLDGRHIEGTSDGVLRGLLGRFEGAYNGIIDCRSGGRDVLTNYRLSSSE